MTKRGTRQDIQFLRFIAVSMVTLFHFWPGKLSGGFAGVDVFFVISGFLISGSLIRSLQGDTGIDVLRFWAGRIRRLVPAALFVSVLSFFGLFLFVQPEQRVSSIAHFVPSFLYYENIQLQLDSTDYFADTNPSVYQHFWSLAVEEQFYIVWPLALLLIASLSKKGGNLGRNLNLGIGLATVLSFSFGVYQTFTNPGAAYFDSFSRAWEFGLGAMLATTNFKFLKRYPKVFSTIGFLAIFVTAFFIDADASFPGFMALLPAVGAALVIGSGLTSGFVSKFMAFRPFQFLGDISYSLYLWHWPVIVLLSFGFGTRPSNFWLVTGLALSVLLAWLTKKFVEDPIRYSKTKVFSQTSKTFIALAGTLGLVASLALGGLILNNQAIKTNSDLLVRDLENNAGYCLGAQSIDSFGLSCSPAPNDLRIPRDYRQISQITPGEIWTDECRTNLTEKEIRSCTFGDKNSKTVVALVGDSHAASWFPAIRSIVETNNWKLVTYYKSGCTLAVGIRSDLKPGKASSCQWWQEAVLRELMESKITIVVVGYAKSSLNIQPRGNENAQTAATRSLSNMMTALQETGKVVVAVRDNPIPGKNLAPCLLLNQAAPHKCDLNRKTVVKTPDPMELASRGHAKVILADFTEYFCGPKICPALIGGVYPYKDDDHVVRTYVMTLVPVWDVLLRQALSLKAATAN